MALFKWHWLRSFVRRNTNQIPEEQAEIWKKRLSLGYMLITWNALGFVGYMVYSGKIDWAKKYKTEEYLNLTPAQQFSRTLGIKDAKVLRVSGLDVSTYEIHNEDLEKSTVYKKVDEVVKE